MFLFYLFLSGGLFAVEAERGGGAEESWSGVGFFGFGVAFGFTFGFGFDFGFGSAVADGVGMGMILVGAAGEAMYIFSAGGAGFGLKKLAMGAAAAAFFSSLSVFCVFGGGADGVWLPKNERNSSCSVSRFLFARGFGADPERKEC